MVRSVTMPALSSVLTSTRKTFVLSRMARLRPPPKASRTRRTQHRWVETEPFVDVAALRQARQVEQQGLEHLRRPVLDPLVLLPAQLREGAVGPDLAELVMERLVGHDE